MCPRGRMKKTNERWRRVLIKIDELAEISPVPLHTRDSITHHMSDLPTAFDPSTCVRKGLCPVTTIRGQGANVFESHSLYYEQHGQGNDHKIVFIMGLNSSSFSWAPQVQHFGQSKTHTALVFDNRGVGNSGYPRGPYTCVRLAKLK